MKRINFVQKLVDEGKISLIEPSDEIRKSYNHKSENSLRAAKILSSQSLLEESTSMGYYAMFHKVISLFQLIGIKCENHAAAIILLKELFGIENKDISLQKKKELINNIIQTLSSLKMMLKIS